MKPNPIQVWCDVGGTFTDCIVVDADGLRKSTKVLSHGRFKGHATEWLSPTIFIDHSRTSDPNDFWLGSTVRWLDSRGEVIDETRCIAFDCSIGRLTIERPVHLKPESILDNPPSIYELISGIEAPVLSTRWLLNCPPHEPLPALQVRLGTTRGTNALLTRSGAKTVFATTRGFADLLSIGYQERPELFQLRVRKRPALAERIVEVPERIAADGEVLEALDVSLTRERLIQAFEEGYRSLAICLIHSYAYPQHEMEVERIASEVGFECICRSSFVSPMMKAVSRGETTVVDAYLTPVIQQYMRRLSEQFGDQSSTSLRIMASHGGLAHSADYRGRDSVLSGPAGGAVALEVISRELSIPKLIGLDMGGTSTDVCRIDGRLQLEYETIKAGVRMMAPTLSIHTVAAGGGSVCWFDGVQLRVGPNSAGSSPGPASYGAGGPLTITDLNLLERRIDRNRFPFQLDDSAAQRRVEEILVQVNASRTIYPMSAEDLIHGLRRIANEQMASAVRAISIERGADPREHVLVGFGGAAGQHICEVAELLGITEVIDHPQAGLLSALGMGLASISRSYVHPLYQPIARLDWNTLHSVRDEWRLRAESDFRSEGIERNLIQETFQLELRYVGLEGSIVVEWLSDDVRALSDQYQSLYRERFGYVRAGRAIEVVSLRAELRSKNTNSACATQSNKVNGLAAERRIDILFSNGEWRQADVYSRDGLHTRQIIVGPAIVSNDGHTLVIDQGWTASLDSNGIIRIKHKREDNSNSTAAIDTLRTVDPVLREVLAQRIAAIADQMGIVLEQTALSVNVKDRRDFSCAVFSSLGDLIANAPHVPVHLGAMSETVQAMMVEFPRMYPGDCFVTNDPYRGGSHLPDITVVTPVFVKENGTAPDFFVASRAHHAEVGGIAPGSMAPTSTMLGDEGIILPPMYLLQAGEDRTADVERLLKSGPFPSRAVPENLADLAAQQAANVRGVTAMIQLANETGTSRLKRYVEHLLDAAHAKTIAWIRGLANDRWQFADHMDDGTRIAVCITKQGPVDNPSLLLDFDGTGPTCKGNLNANPAIVKAAILYVIRCAIDDSLPLNSGVLRSIMMRIPPGILNPITSGPKETWPAVAGGNVETSQRVVDCLLGAFGMAAASQGTMNNFLFGDSSFGYYETIGGGSGATDGMHGESAVHTHMTNTRLTDVEVLESRYPVRLCQFSIRRNSGGRGKYDGGDGMVREIMALKPLEVSLVTSRRGPYAPFGLQGGGFGKLGENWLTRSGAEPERLPSSCQLSLNIGDRIAIFTPGGGAFGEAV